MTNKNQRIRWPEIIERVKEEILPLFAREGVKPTLRMVFYQLVAQNVLPNTKSTYQALSRALVKARQDGEIPFDALEDRGRYSIDNFGDEYLTEEDLDDVQERCDVKIDEIDLDTLLEDYFCGVRLDVPYNGYWACQPVIPEIWVEKDAIAPTIERWVVDLYTTIRVNRGYGGWSFLYTSTQNLKAVLDCEEHEKAVIFYIGDLDPSGTDMDRHLAGVLAFFELTDRVEFRRLALLPEQVEQYHLPPRPEDAETLAKVARDPRSKKYALEYIVEVDAFLGLAPDAFRTLISTAISELQDEAIYEEVQENNRELSNYTQRMRERAIERAKEDLLSQINGAAEGTA